MPANPRVTRAAEDGALDLALATRGTKFELAARENQRMVRAQSGLLRVIESLARDGMITPNTLSEYGDVLSLFASPVREDDASAAVAAD